MEPPHELDGARVLKYSAVNKASGPAKEWSWDGYGPEVADGVAIAQYEAEPDDGFYLFWLRDGGVIADTLHFSVRDAVESAERNWDDLEWIDVFKPARDTMDPPPGWPPGLPLG